MLTVDSLATVMGHAVSVERYTQLLPWVNKCLLECECTTIARASMWYGQIKPESGGLRYMREIASGAEYEGRKDLGNTQSGDGVRFAGRGPIQVTGRSNYTILSQWAFKRGLVPTATFFVDQPEQLEKDEYAFLGVTWYWTRANINFWADGNNIEDGSKAVNRPAAIGNPTIRANGIDARIAAWRLAQSMGESVLPNPDGVKIIARPDFQEINLIGTRKISDQCQNRGTTAIDLLLGHTVEGNSDGLDLVAFMEQMGERSYHYIISLDGKTVWDLVDTDDAAWSVGDGNNRSINYVIGATFADWTRQEWIDNARNAIRTMAYLMVMDGLKYAVPVKVLKPSPNDRDFYPDNPPGVSDHRYITKHIGWGTHTDMGDEFPFDILESDINELADGTSDLSAEAERMIKEMYDEWNKGKIGPSRSFLAPDANPIESPLGFLYNIDGNAWNLLNVWAYLFGMPYAVELVENVADHGVAPESYAGHNEFVGEYGQNFCKALVEFRKELKTALAVSESISSQKGTNTP